MHVLHLLVDSLMHKSIQYNSSSGEPDAAVDGTLHGGLNVATEGTP